MKFKSHAVSYNPSSFPPVISPVVFDDMSEDTQELLDLVNALINSRMQEGGIRKQEGQISSTENEPLSTLMEMR